MDVVVRVVDILDFNKTRRMAYERVLARPTSREGAQNAVSLLLWMETTLAGFEMLGKVAETTTDDDALMWIVLEADAVYNFLLHGHDLPEDLEGVPSLAAMSGDRLVDSRFFSFHRSLVVRGLAFLRDGVAALIFDDGLHAMMRVLRESKVCLQWGKLPPELAAPYVVKSRTPPAPEDSRSAFIVFTGDQPISQEEITSYFNEKCEGCIESVATEEAVEDEEGETPPKHGIIVFSDPVLRDTVMNQENSASFDVNGESIWVQLYQQLS